jgi:tetratricopeptide (TPR) repeat protein
MHWQAALKIIKNRSIGRILLGSGLGSQRFYLPKYYRPEFAIYESPNIYLDYVHNDILDTLLTSGVLGLISYLSLIGLIFYFGFKGMRENILSLFLLTGLVGYLISLQFSFHIMSTLPYFWLFIILLLIIPLKQDPALAVTNSIRLTDDQQWNSEIIGQQNNRILKNFSIVLIVFLTCFLIWWFNLRLYLASHYLLKATLEKLKNNWSAMVKYHELSVKYQPDNPYFRQQFALALLQSAPFQKNPDQIIKFYDLGINQIKAIPFQEWPIEARHWIAWLLTEKANFTHNQNDFREAKKAYQELADFTPGTALVYNNWCGLLVAEQKWMESIKMCQKAISLYPDLNHPQLNSEHREKIIAELISVYHKLAIAYFQLQDYQTSLSYYEKILHLDPNQTIIWLKIAQIYYLQKDIETAINKLYHGYIREPQNSQWALILSDLYQEKGDLEKANYWSMIAKTLNH